MCDAVWHIKLGLNQFFSFFGWINSVLLIHADHCVIAVSLSVSIFGQYFAIGRNVEEKYARLNQLLLSGFADWNDLRCVIAHEIICAAHSC